jgi:hypothetical protein
VLYWLTMRNHKIIYLVKIFQTESILFHPDNPGNYHSRDRLIRLIVSAFLWHRNIPMLRIHLQAVGFIANDDVLPGREIDDLKK